MLFFLNIFWFDFVHNSQEDYFFSQLYWVFFVNYGESQYIPILFIQLIYNVL